MASTNSRLRYRMAAIVVLSGLSLLTTTRFPRPLAAQTPARPANGQPTATLTIKITGARNAKGQVGVALFQEAKGFPEDASNAIRRQNVDIDPQSLSAEIVFRDIPQGIYAVSVRHDENMNGKLDKNFVGIPKEGYGASNNPKKNRRAPTFDEAKFPLDSQQTLEVKLTY